MPCAKSDYVTCTRLIKSDQIRFQSYFGCVLCVLQQLNTMVRSCENDVHRCRNDEQSLRIFSDSGAEPGSHPRQRRHSATFAFPFRTERDEEEKEEEI